LPVVVLESLAARVPVVATAVGGTAEVIEDGVSGFLVPPGDPRALAARIHNVLRDDAGRLAMGRRGRRRVEEAFTFAAQSVQYQQLFQGLIRGRPLKKFPQAVVNGYGALPAQHAG
jgi:glycosyltransferase involved in cell wall biosynthesis